MSLRLFPLYSQSPCSQESRFQILVAVSISREHLLHSFWTRYLEDVIHLWKKLKLYATSNLLLLFYTAVTSYLYWKFGDNLLNEIVPSAKSSPSEFHC